VCVRTLSASSSELEKRTVHYKDSKSASLLPPAAEDLSAGTPVRDVGKSASQRVHPVLTQTLKPKTIWAHCGMAKVVPGYKAGDVFHELSRLA